MECIRPFTLRELCWRARAGEMRRWDYVAWLCVHILAPHTKQSLNAQKFHPMRHVSDRADIGDLHTWVKDAGQQLPKQLSEEEKEIRWQEHLAKQRKREHGN